VTRDDVAMPEPVDGDPAALLRRTRGLERKLLRSETSRAALEESKDRADALYRNIIRETEEQKLLLDEKNRMLEALSSKLSKYLAPQVYQSIFSGSQDVSLETKRKKLTVFFSDLKDFTQITDDLEAEELTDLLNEYFTEMSKIALEHGATIDKFVGDAMLMFFGDPETRGVADDAAACVAMAIAMQRRMRELQAEWHRRGIQRPLRMRIGINTGYCNVGNFGSADRMAYTIIGGEVNLAARLETQANPDGILVSSETYALVRGKVPAEEWPSMQVKGIRREIRPYSLTDFLDEPEADEIIRSELEGMSVRIDLRNLDDDRRREFLLQLGHIADQLKIVDAPRTQGSDGGGSPSTS
jgi:adenylate cyclase